jgi:hypothetical protein
MKPGKSARRFIGYVDAELHTNCQCRMCHEAQHAKAILFHVTCSCLDCTAARRLVRQIGAIHEEQGGLCRAEFIGVGNADGRVPRRIAPKYAVVQVPAAAVIDIQTRRAVA